MSLAATPVQLEVMAATSMSGKRLTESDPCLIVIRRAYWPSWYYGVMEHC